MSLRPLRQAQPTLGPIKKSVRGRWRAVVLIGVHVLIALHVWQFHIHGVTVSPVEPSEAMQTLELGLVNAGFVFFVLAILSTLIFGRFFCGWACHVVALQDICSSILKRFGWQPKPFRSRLLVWVPVIAALYMFVWPMVSRMLQGVPLPRFTQHFLTDDFWGTFPNLGITLLTFAVCGGLIVVLLGNKGFCTYGCPYGAAFYYADRWAKGKIRVTDACNGCGHCTSVCSSNVRVHEEVKLHKMVVDPACLKCMDCVDVCPSKALYFGMGPTAGKLRPRRTYDYSWPEEILMAAAFVVSFYAFRSLYEMIPFLLTLGWSAIFAFLTVTWVRLWTKPALRFQRWQLKEKGSVRAPGWVYAVACVGLFGITAHSATIQYWTHEANGALYAAQDIYDGRVRASEQQAEALARESYATFTKLQGMALVPVAGWRHRMGSIQEFLGQPEAALAHYREALALDSRLVASRQRLISILSQRGEWSQAAELAAVWREQFPHRVPPRRALGITLANSGDKARAREHLEWVFTREPKDHEVAATLAMIRAEDRDFPGALALLDQAISQEPERGPYRLNRVLVLAAMGQLEQAQEEMTRVRRIMPRDPRVQRVALDLAWQRGDFAAAQEILEALRTLRPWDPAIVALWVEQTRRSGKPIHPSMPLDANRPEDAYILSAVAAETGDRREALRLFRVALRGNPEILPPWDTNSQNAP